MTDLTERLAAKLRPDGLSQGDCLDVMRGMDAGSVNCCVTSPPYFGLRDYGVAGQLGLEPTPEEYVAKMVLVFREVRRVLRDDGTLWLNLGDSYARGFGGGSPGAKSSSNVGSYASRQAGRVPDGMKGKDLIGIPWMVAFALRADGWYLRSDIIWHKPNPMPESVRDRPTKAHEYLFLLTKSERYFYDAAAVAEQAVGGWNGSKFDHGKTGQHQLGRSCTKPRDADTNTRNARSVWTIATKGFKGAHFAVMPEALAEKCVLAGCPVGGTVLDPFTGSGTVGVVAVKNGRGFVGVELNPEYAAMARGRISAAVPDLTLGLEASHV